MTISGFAAVFAVGCFGGAIGEVAKWFQLRESPNLPDYAKRPLYWIATIVMITFGGGLALLYGVEERSAILVANIGLSAPLIVKALAAVVPAGAVPKGLGAPKASLREFLAGR